MKPDLPLTWISTTTLNRDQGRFHLTATHSLASGLYVEAACGARPFSYGGTYPDGSSFVGNNRCQRCEAYAKKMRKP